MIFGRKRRAIDPADAADEAEPAAVESQAPGDPDPEQANEAEATGETGKEAAAADSESDANSDGGQVPDWRTNGPFDIEEVDLHDDKVTRIDLGPLIVTPWDGLGLQLQVDEQTRQVQAVTGVWQNSGLEVVLFAAPASGGLADEMREDIIDEAERAGGSAVVSNGVFGPQVHRVLPQEGPKGEQLFRVSRIWFAEGPRWMLRASLLGEAALGEPDSPEAGPFLELFRNLVVRRGDKPMVPGELITLILPETVD